jgi:hypothetical protein
MDPASDEVPVAKSSKVKPLDLAGLVDSRLQLGYSPKGEKTILFATKGDGENQGKSFIRSKDITGNMYVSCLLPPSSHCQV